MIKLFTVLLISISYASFAQNVYIDKKLKKPVVINDSFPMDPADEYFPVKVRDLDTLFANILYLKNKMKPVERAKLQSYKLYSGSTTIVVTTVAHAYADAYDVTLITIVGNTKAEYLVGNNKELNAKSIKNLTAFTNLIQSNSTLKIKELDNYEPIIYEPESLVINPEYKPGSIIYSGEEEKGFILFEYDNEKEFRFRKNRADKRQKITVEECLGFKVDSKVFKVILLNNKNVFAESVINGKIGLYKVYVAKPGTYYSTLGAGGVMVSGGYNSTIDTQYILETAIPGEFIIISEKKKRFRSQAEMIFKDRPDIVTKIKDGIYSIKNIEQLVREYNK